jgi:hypothetical protein
MTQSLLKDFQIVPAIQLYATGAEQRPDGTRRTALFADNLTYIAGGNPELEHGDLFALDDMDGNLVRIVHERFGDVFH